MSYTTNDVGKAVQDNQLLLAFTLVLTGVNLVILVLFVVLP